MLFLPYRDRIRSIAKESNIIRFYSLNEQSGLVAIDHSFNKENGAYISATLDAGNSFDGYSCPSFDGINDFVDCDTNIGTDFNGANGSAIIAFKMTDSAVWSDGITRYFFNMRESGSNQMKIRKVSANNTILLIIEGNSAHKEYKHDFGSATLDWHIIGITWNSTSGNVYYYVDGVQVSSDTGYQSWSAQPGELKIGSDSNGNGNFHKGNLSNFVLTDTDLSQANMEILTRVIA